MADPIEQFQVHPLPGMEFGEVTLPLIGTQQIAVTNSHVAMTIAFVMVVTFLALATSNAKVVPGRLQAAGEQLFGLISGVTDSMIGPEGRKYFPFVFSLFIFILAMNLLGMFLTFTATSQLAVTGTLAAVTILLVIGIGFLKHGLGFFKLFWPSSAPAAIRPAVGLIEFISFLLRPITLALRLFGIMLGGHIALKIFAIFVVGLGGLAFSGDALGLLGLPVAALSLGMVIGITALEFLVAFLQAFVFAVLTSIYLNDVVNLGHGH